MTYQPDLTLAEARGYIDRALAKARELKQAAAFVVVDAAGNLVSVSRIGEGATSSVWVSRAKAYVAAVQRAPSARNATSWRDSPVLFASFQRLMRDDIFPGPGGMPIRKDGRVVSAISTGGGLGPWTEIPGIDPGLLTAEGAPANAEDLIIAYALQVPYQNQHEEGRRIAGPRTEERVDDLPHTLATARAIADGVIAAAARQGVAVGVAVVDELGQLMQMDRMDGATLQSPDLAEAKALTALNFQRPSTEVAKRFTPERLVQIQASAHYKILSAGGGVPIVRDGQVVGAVGVSGNGGENNEDLARAGFAV